MCQVLKEEQRYEGENMFTLPQTSARSRDETPSPKPLTQLAMKKSPKFVVDTPKIIKKRCWFVQLPPEALATIADVLGVRLPLFMFTNRQSFKQTIQGQLHFYEMQRQGVLRSVFVLEQEVKRQFVLSD
jgi:hypothetical protein